MCNLQLIEQRLLYSFICLFVLNNAKFVTSDTDLSLTYNLIKGIVRDEIKDLAGELKTDIKRIDERCAGIEQQIRDLKAVSVEDTPVESNDVTTETVLKSVKQQMDRLSTVIYRTLSKEKQLIRNTIVGFEDRIHEFEKSVTDNKNNILRLQTFVGSSFKTIQTDICIIPTTTDDKITIQTVHDDTLLAANSEVSADAEVTLDCSGTSAEPSNIIIKCDRGQWVYESPESWESATKDNFPKCPVYCVPSGKLVEQSEKLLYKHGERFECGQDHRLAGDSVCQNGEWTSEPDCVSNITPRDCQDAQELGIKSTGVYTISPKAGASFQVRCDMDTAGGEWTVIQRRVNASDFYKTWEEYKDGFGDLDVNFWLGNDNIHTLADSGSYSLRVDLTAPDGETGYATYSSFSIGNEADKYRLSIDGYSGNIGDSLEYHNGMAFTTKDRDNDESSYKCAVQWSGAWWYNNCYHSHLNGLYGSENSNGLNWQIWKGYSASMTRTQLAIKRV